MSDFEEDLIMYEEAVGPAVKHLDNQVLLSPISVLEYPTDPLSVTPDTPVLDALRAMAERRIGAVLVKDTGSGALIGIFSERDALRKGLYSPDNAASLSDPVRDYMTADPECLTPHDTIAHALNRMTEGRYRHVPLKDAQTGAPAGLLIMRDVVSYIVSFFPAEVLNVPPHSEHDPPSRTPEGG